MDSPGPYRRLPCERVSMACSFLSMKHLRVGAVLVLWMSATHPSVKAAVPSRRVERVQKEMALTLSMSCFCFLCQTMCIGFYCQPDSMGLVTWLFFFFSLYVKLNFMFSGLQCDNFGLLTASGAPHDCHPH